MDAPDGRLNWKFRSLSFSDGASNLTTTQYANINAASANFYGRSLGRSFMQEGVTPAGTFIHNEIFKMWLKRRLQEKCLEVFTSNKIVTYDSRGMAKVEAGLSETLASAQTFGHASIDVPPTLNIPDPRTVSSAVKQSGVLTITGSIVDAGGVNKINFTLNVYFS